MPTVRKPVTRPRNAFTQRRRGGYFLGVFIITKTKSVVQRGSSRRGLAERPRAGVAIKLRLGITRQGRGIRPRPTSNGSRKRDPPQPGVGNLIDGAKRRFRGLLRPRGEGM